MISMVFMFYKKINLLYKTQKELSTVSVVLYVIKLTACVLILLHMLSCFHSVLITSKKWRKWIIENTWQVRPGRNITPRVPEYRNPPLA